MDRIRAHFDGKHIVPDEPVDFVPGERLNIERAPQPKNASTKTRKPKAAARSAARRAITPPKARLTKAQQRRRSQIMALRGTLENLPGPSHLPNRADLYDDRL